VPSFERAVASADNLAAIEPQRSIYDVMPLEQRISNEYSADRLRTAVTALFAGAALLLVPGTLSAVIVSVLLVAAAAALVPAVLASRVDPMTALRDNSDEGSGADRPRRVA
jgi:UPF0716 family protein affecting phage T7 exclusion